jgi:hypothetical protein
LFAAGIKERSALEKRIKQQVAIGDDDEERLRVNIARFDEVLTKNSNILKVSVIDEDLPGDNPDRKSESDVLEIFVRVNREGTPLSRSDLIFSMLKLNWRESAESLPEFVREINEGNAFTLDTDFVIRCLFAVSDLGTKFDLDHLRRKNNVNLLRSVQEGSAGGTVDSNGDYTAPNVTGTFHVIATSQMYPSEHATSTIVTTPVNCACRPFRHQRIRL